MHWYLVHTKPKQEKCAQENLERQGYPCYLPLLSAEKMRRKQVALADEPLFPRYLFIQLGLSDSAKSWVPIRSTKGVSGLVRFGTTPAKVDDALIEHLRMQEAMAHAAPLRLFAPGERVRLSEGPFAGIEGVYQMADGTQRAIVFIELLSKLVAVPVTPASLRKVS